MSDRRPENPKLWELCEHGNFECWEKRDLGINVTPTMVRCKGAREASPADLLAAVRRGVESGTIKGKVTKVEHDYHDHHASDGNLVEAGTYLVIPVSDGGSET